MVVRAGQVLLIATRGGKRWGLPKGRLEAGETPEQAAVREVREETGITGRITVPLTTVEYTFWGGPGRRIHKKVDYYLLAYDSGDLGNFDPREVSAANWFTFDEALAKLTFENDKKVIRAALTALAGALEPLPLSPPPEPAA